MKKLISLLVVTAMLVTGLVVVVPGTAADLPETDLYTHLTGEISSDKTTLTMNVNLENNPGLWCYRIFVSYNAKALKLISIENKDVWSSQEYLPGNINSNPVTYYAQSGAYNVNNTKTGLVAVYTFEILNENLVFNLNLTVNPKEVFGVDETGTKIPHEMRIINECPQEVPFDTTALDELAADIMGLPAYEEMNEEQIAKMLALYDSVHNMKDKAAAYFTENHADAIAKIDELYAAHQWAEEKKELDALGARVEALPVYANMTEAQIGEMLALRTEIAALGETQKAYVEENFADALTRLNASYDAYMHEQDLDAIGARIDALPAYSSSMTEAQVQEMLALITELSALPEADLAYIQSTYAQGYNRLQNTYADYQHFTELKAIGARVEALPAYSKMTEEQVQEMLTLIELFKTMPPEDVAYISAAFDSAYTRLNESFARYTRNQELDALGARIAALPDSFYDMTEADITEMLALIEIIDTIGDADDQEYLIENYGDVLLELATNYAIYQIEEEVKALQERIEALPNYEEITEEYLDEVVSIREELWGTILALRFQEKIPEAYENFVNAYFKLVYGGTEAVDMDKINAFVESANKLIAIGDLNAEQKAEVLDLLYDLALMEENDTIAYDYIALNHPKAEVGLFEKYIEILESEEVDGELLESLQEDILALPAYDKMTKEDKAALEEIISKVSGLSPLEMYQFKIAYPEAYEKYVALYEAYEADKGTEEPPVTTDPGQGGTTEPGKDTNNDKKPVQTGDNMMYIVIAAAVAAVACGAVVVIRKKKESV